LTFVSFKTRSMYRRQIESQPLAVPFASLT
jgi:hypothetical protein